MEQYAPGISGSQAAACACSCALLLWTMGCRDAAMASSSGSLWPGQRGIPPTLTSGAGRSPGAFDSAWRAAIPLSVAPPIAARAVARRRSDGSSSRPPTRSWPADQGAASAIQICTTAGASVEANPSATACAASSSAALKSALRAAGSSAASGSARRWTPPCSAIRRARSANRRTPGSRPRLRRLPRLTRGAGRWVGTGGRERLGAAPLAGEEIGTARRQIRGNRSGFAT